MVEAVDAAATVVGVKVVADEVGRFAKLKAPPVLAEVSDGITKPVDGADVAGVEGALVFAGIEKLGPPPWLLLVVAPANENPPEDAAPPEAPPNEPKIPPVEAREGVDEAVAEEAKEKPLALVGAMAVDEKIEEEAAVVEGVAAAELAGRENEGIEGEGILKRDGADAGCPDAGVARDEKLEPNKGLDEVAGVGVVDPNAEPPSGAVAATAGVVAVWVPKANPEKGEDAGAGEGVAALEDGVWAPNPNVVVWAAELEEAPPKENPGGDAAGADAGVANGEGEEKLAETAGLDGAPKMEEGVELVPNAGVELAPKAGVELVPNAGVELAPEAGVELVPKAGVELAPKAGVEGLLPNKEPPPNPPKPALEAAAAGAEAVVAAGFAPNAELPKALLPKPKDDAAPEEAAVPNGLGLGLWKDGTAPELASGDEDWEPVIENGVEVAVAPKREGAEGVDEAPKIDGAAAVVPIALLLLAWANAKGDGEAEEGVVAPKREGVEEAAPPPKIEGVEEVLPKGELLAGAPNAPGVEPKAPNPVEAVDPNNPPPAGAGAGAPAAGVDPNAGAVEVPKENAIPEPCDPGAEKPPNPAILLCLLLATKFNPLKCSRANPKCRTKLDL
jgi:hypothetical protein